MNKYLKAMSDYTIASRYARYLPEKKRRTIWGEQVGIVKEMQLERYPQAKTDIEWSFDYVMKKRVLGSQRALQFGGDPIKKKNARIYNCTSSYVDRPRFFQEAFWLLLCGCFHPDTKVKTKCGDKKIKDISLDDEILSFDEKTRNFIYKNPLKVFENETQDSDKIELEMEDGTKILCTSNHKFLTKNRDWVEAKDLTESDDIINYEN